MKGGKMRNNNQIGIVIGISVVVALIVSALFTVFSANVQLGPTTPSINPEVFTVWGKDSCPTASRLIYQGQAGTEIMAATISNSGISDSGSGSTICVSNELSEEVESAEGAGILFMKSMLNNEIHYHTSVPCAVCKY